MLKFAKAGAMGHGVYLHFPVPSMIRLNQTEPATFSILPCWAFFRDSVFLYFEENTLLIDIIYNKTRIVYFLFGFKLQVHCKFNHLHYF
jgi:hypothetical protein